MGRVLYEFQDWGKLGGIEERGTGKKTGMRQVEVKERKKEGRGIGKGVGLQKEKEKERELR